MLRNSVEVTREFPSHFWKNTTFNGLAELKTETLKAENDIDIIYEDVKPEICEEKPNLLIGEEIEANSSREFSIDFWANTTFTGLAGELAKSRDNHFTNGVILKNEDEDQPEYIGDSWTNSADSITEALKTEDDIGVIYKDIKPEICEEKPVLSVGTEIEANFSRELLIESGTRLQQNMATKENEIALKRENDTRMALTITINGEKQFQCKKVGFLISFKAFMFRTHSRVILLSLPTL
ncbi:hypothetical protein JTB14_027805 [Gonioctena quinquepunctata]|nr:hypothetical protein JTB14_027805 [Gonioctena quinquepunctata]